jgi:hypothetical protein
MGAVLNRTSLQYIEFVNTPDYDPTVWVIDPDITPVESVSSMFWFINSDDSLSIMTDAQMTTAYLTVAITNQCNAVSNYRNQILSAGFSYNSDLYDSDPISIANVTATQTFIASGGTLPDTFVWRDANNNNQSYNNTTFTEFYMASILWAETIYIISWTHKANISALTDYDDVMSYDYTVDWPTGFASGAVTYT